MSGLGADYNVNKLSNLSLEKNVQVTVKKENENVTVSSLKSTEKLELSNTLKGEAINNLNLVSENSKSLPKVTVEVDGAFTFYTNAYGNKITEFRKDTGTSYNTLSPDGLAIILSDNKGKGDVFSFSAMTDKVLKNSNIYDNYFKLEQTGTSKMYFDENHNIVLELNSKDKLVLDGKDGKTVLEGPFKINFNPDSDGHDFKVTYTGSDNLKRHTARGGNFKFN